MRISYSLTPAALLAAGSFASQAGAAVAVFNITPDPTLAGTSVTIGSGAADGAAQFRYGVKDGDTTLFANQEGSGNVTTPFSTYRLANSNDDFETKANVTNTSGADAYYGLRFDIGTEQYFGVATIGSAEFVEDADGTRTFTPNTEVLEQIEYELAPAVVTALPEPATWASMVAGFGVVGGAARAARRRRQAIAKAA